VRRPALVRPLSLADLPGCEALSRAIGWPWEAPKWALLLSKGTGFAVDAPDGGLAGTVVLNRFADKAASVGLLGVVPAWGRKGLGRALMARALEAAGNVPVFLYATEPGRALYAQLGFQVVGGSVRLVGPRLHPGASPPLGARRLRRMEAADLSAAAALDAVAFGAPRPQYLEGLFRMKDEARVAEDGQGLVGYGLSWTIGTRRTVGPIVAPDVDVATAILADLCLAPSGTLRVDIPSECPELAGWATRLGLRPERAAPLMVRNAERLPGRREWLYALAMPGLG
jgi:ribosomal protein S18 acetylase RimI-like enzyme